MKKEEFVAAFAARWHGLYAKDKPDHANEDSIGAALSLAHELEKHGFAPWNLPSEQEEPNSQDLFGDVKVAAVVVNPPGSSIGFGNGKENGAGSKEAVLPAGAWELSFRPAAVTNGGLTLPPGAAHPKN